MQRSAMGLSAQTHNAGSRHPVEPRKRKRKRSPSKERRDAKRAMERALAHAAALDETANELSDRLASIVGPNRTPNAEQRPEINAAAVLATDLEAMYEQHRRGKAAAAKAVVENFDGIERTKYYRPRKEMHQESLKPPKHLRNPKLTKGWRGE